MSDNIILPLTGEGDETLTAATDNIAGVHYQKIKIVWGANGTATATTANTPFPVTISSNISATQSGTWTITDISGTISLPTGASTAAKQPALGTAGSASSDVITIQGVSSMTPIRVDSVLVPTAANTGATASVTATSVTILAANSTRKGAKLYASPNNTDTVYVKLGATATASNFPMLPGDSFDLNFGVAIYTGVVDAIAASGTQSISLMEL